MTSISPASPVPRRRRLAFPREVILAGLIVIITSALSLAGLVFPPLRAFSTVDNFNAILRNLAFEGILATAMMLLMVAGVFDLSVGGMASLCGVVAGWLMKKAGWPVPLAVVAALATAALGGCLNGVIVAKVRVNALITTLGTMGVFSGFALLVGGPGITFLPDSFSRLGQAELAGIQAPVWLMAALAAAAGFLLSRTRFFRQYYYIGSNPKAAHLSGINVERMQILAFTIAGTIAGLAGIVYASRIQTASSTVGVGAELQAITAVILGGASLTGGRGTIFGAMAGVFFMALMKNVLIILRITSEWQGIILGAVLVVAVGADSIMNRRQER